MKAMKITLNDMLSMLEKPLIIKHKRRVLDRISYTPIIPRMVPGFKTVGSIQSLRILDDELKQF